MTRVSDNMPFPAVLSGSAAVRALRVDFCQWGSGGFREDGWVHTKTVPYTILVQPLEGRYEVLWGMHHAVIEAGAFGIVPANTEVTFIHHFPAGGTMRARWLHLQATLFGAALLDTFVDLPVTPPSDRAEELSRHGLLDAPPADGTLESLTTRAARAYAVAAWLCRCGTPSASWEALTRSGPRLLPVLSYVQTHLADHLTVEVIARQANLSPSRFHAVFVEHLGTGPMAYVRHLRMAEACRLLLRDDTSVAEAGRLVGFENQFHFSRAFRKHTGVCPREYRRTHAGLLV